MRLALAIASFVVLIVHGVVFYDQFFYRWERHQTAYFEQARSLSKNARGARRVGRRGLRISSRSSSRSFGDTHVDRCATCHMAADDPRFAGHAEPLKTHPYSAAMGDVLRNGRWERRHKFSDFGCTVCHDGQGRGLDTYYSHGEDEFWPEPLLGYVTQPNWRKDFAPQLKGKEYMEANCAQCHTDEDFAGTPNVNRGRKLFYAMNCYGCHKIDGMSEGTLGPDLTEAGKKFKIDYLWESIVEPRANLDTSFMPNFHLGDEDVKALVIFLKSRRGVNFAETSLDRYKAHIANVAVVIPPGSAGDKAGEQLLADRACTACHKLRDRDGGIAPDLSLRRAGARRRLADGPLQESALAHSRFHHAHLPLPRGGLPAPLGVSGEPQDSARRRMTPADDLQELCARCHGEKGDGHGKVAWYLDPSPRDFTKAGFMTSKPRERFLDVHQRRACRAPRCRPGATRSERRPGGWRARLTCSQTFTKEPRRSSRPRNVPDHNPVATVPPPSAARRADLPGALHRLPRPQSRRQRPQLARYLSAPAQPAQQLVRRQGWRTGAFSNPSSTACRARPCRRGSITASSQHDVGDIINFIRSLNRNREASRYARR